MQGLSRIKSWLKRKNFISIEKVGDTNSEYFQLEGFPITIRIGDHLGRTSTISDKYLNILPGNSVNTYILVLDKTTQIVSHKELLKVISSLMALYSTIPDFLKFKSELRKEVQLKELDYTKEINNLKSSYKASTLKMRDKLKKYSEILKTLNNQLIVEMNNLQ